MELFDLRNYQQLNVSNGNLPIAPIKQDAKNSSKKVTYTYKRIKLPRCHTAKKQNV